MTLVPVVVETDKPRTDYYRVPAIMDTILMVFDNCLIYRYFLAKNSMKDVG